jgi:hypothetical protein
MNKAESLADAKATKYDSIGYEDVKVTVFGDTAIATGGSKAKGIDSSGKPIENHVRWTDTWVKMPNGKWQCVLNHVSPVKMYRRGSYDNSRKHEVGRSRVNTLTRELVEQKTPGQNSTD